MLDYALYYLALYYLDDLQPIQYFVGIFVIAFFLLRRLQTAPKFDADENGRVRVRGVEAL